MSKSIFVGLFIFVVLSISIFQRWKWKKGLQKLNFNRPKLEREEYILILLDKGFERNHIEVVHDEINEFIDINNFSMYPEDDIHRLYKIVDLDDVELIDRICNKLNIRNAEQEDYDLTGKKYRNTTAESILYLLAHLQK